MSLDPTTSAIEEIRSLKAECLGVLRSLKDFCPPDSNERFPDTFRLIATPMLYSTWERCFTLCHAISFRLVRDTCEKCNELTPFQQAAWLLRAPFYQSFIAQIHNQGLAKSKKNSTSNGQFNHLSQFIVGLEAWGRAPLDQSFETDDLVMFSSNVNKDVVDLNARALGIADYEPFKQMKFDQLNELVNRRNDVGHGSTLKGPSNPDFNRLWQFTEKLMQDYCDTFISFIQMRFTRIPLASSESPAPITKPGMD